MATVQMLLAQGRAVTGVCKGMSIIACHACCLRGSGRCQSVKFFFSCCCSFMSTGNAHATAWSVCCSCLQTAQVMHD
jgi:hypothetical protein